MRTRLAQLSVLVVVLGTMQAARADDLSPPAWTRLQFQTTVQEWEFQQPGILAPDGTTPGINPFFNPGGMPSATPGPTLTWAASYPLPPYPDFQGVYLAQGGSGDYIDFDIPNWVDFEPVKHVRIQVAGLWFPAGLPTSQFIGAVDNLGGPVVGQFVGDGFSPQAISFEFHRYFDWDLFPNPDSETFRLNFAPGTIIDQVVIDTISVPEPAALASVLLAGLVGLFRRR